MSNNKLNLNYPPPSRGIVVVWSLLATFPFPGSAWHRLQFLAGLRRLGFDVWYVEETDIKLMNPITYWPAPPRDYHLNVNYLANLMNLIGLEDRWIFRLPGQYDKCFGSRNITELRKLYREADVVINHTGAQEIRPDHSDIRCLVYIETDPVVNQIEVASGNSIVIRQLDAHHYLFSYGSNIGSPDCKVPIIRYSWLPTRPSVCTDWWITHKPRNNFSALTTIATWHHFAKDKVWNGQKLPWSKRDEFFRFIDLPSKSKLPLELAIEGINTFDLASLNRHGWRIIPAKDLSNINQYRDYIQTSLGEFTVAKGQYAYSRSGWFSDRSATYLASGRPVITQATGFENSIPTGVGLFSFSTKDEALSAIEAVASDYNRHSSAALEIACEYFSTERVLQGMLSKIGLM